MKASKYDSTKSLKTKKNYRRRKREAPCYLNSKKGLTCITFKEERFINRIHKEIPPNKQVYHI